MAEKAAMTLSLQLQEPMLIVGGSCYRDTAGEHTIVQLNGGPLPSLQK